MKHKLRFSFHEENFAVPVNYRRTIPDLSRTFVPRVVIPLILARYTKYIFSTHALNEFERGNKVARVCYFKTTKTFMYCVRLHKPKGTK